MLLAGKLMAWAMGAVAWTFFWFAIPVMLADQPGATRAQCAVFLLGWPIATAAILIYLGKQRRKAENDRARNIIVRHYGPS